MFHPCYGGTNRTLSKNLTGNISFTYPGQPLEKGLPVRARASNHPIVGCCA